MLFNSYIFLFLFLPLALVGYFGLNRLNKSELSKYFLTGMSLWFYAYFNVSYLWIILTSILVNYICHRQMIKKSHSKMWFVVGLTFNLGLLFYFKYFNFFIDTMNLVFQTSFFLEKILLPLGISFFTFQQIGFIVDTKKGEVEKQPLSDYMLFVTFFPQLIAGPIVSHDEMLPQFKDPSLKRVNAQNLYIGFRVFVLGLAKKILLADTFGQAVNWGYGNYELVHGTSTLLLSIFYIFQLYFDFSGYCDMARGIGHMFNIKITVNFDSPYKAENMQDFWNRWHITLTRFFTRYIYIPLGGSRKGNVRTYLHIFIVFFASGIWHGAGFTFMLWGFLHGIVCVLTRMFHRFKKKHMTFLKEKGFFKQVRKVLAIAATFLFFTFAEIIFRAESLPQAFTLLGSLFEFGQPQVFAELASFFSLPEIWYVLKVLGIDAFSFSAYFSMIAFTVVSTFIVWGCKNIAETESKFKPTVGGCVVLSGLFLWCVTSLSGVSSFLYFNF